MIASYHRTVFNSPTFAIYIRSIILVVCLLTTCTKTLLVLEPRLALVVESELFPLGGSPIRTKHKAGQAIDYPLLHSTIGVMQMIYHPSSISIIICINI